METSCRFLSDAMGNGFSKASLQTSWKQTQTTFGVDQVQLDHRQDMEEHSDSDETSPYEIQATARLHHDLRVVDGKMSFGFLGNIFLDEDG